jgi:hypothetical protein
VLEQEQLDFDPDETENQDRGKRRPDPCQ